MSSFIAVVGSRVAKSIQTSKIVAVDTSKVIWMSKEDPQGVLIDLIEIVLGIRKY